MALRSLAERQETDGVFGRDTWKGDPLLKILDEQQAAEKAAPRRIN
jgi:hypothetical protein